MRRLFLPLVGVLACSADTSRTRSASAIGEAKQSTVAPGRVEHVPVTPLALPSPSHGFVTRESGVHEKGFVVVRDEGNWAAEWRLIVGSYSPAAELPRVDFRTSTLLVATLGFTSPMGSRYPEFVDAIRRGDTLVATLEVGICPKDNDGGDAPVALATVPVHGGPVAFVTRQVESTHCLE